VKRYTGLALHQQQTEQEHRFVIKPVTSDIEDHIRNIAADKYSYSQNRIDQGMHDQLNNLTERQQQIAQIINNAGNAESGMLYSQAFRTDENGWTYSSGDPRSVVADPDGKPVTLNDLRNEIPAMINDMKESYGKLISNIERNFVGKPDISETQSQQEKFEMPHDVSPVEQASSEKEQVQYYDDAILVDSVSQTIGSVVGEPAQEMYTNYDVSPVEQASSEQEQVQYYDDAILVDSVSQTIGSVVGEPAQEMYTNYDVSPVEQASSEQEQVQYYDDAILIDSVSQTIGSVVGEPAQSQVAEEMQLASPVLIPIEEIPAQQQYQAEAEQYSYAQAIMTVGDSDASAQIIDYSASTENEEDKYQEYIGA